MRKLDRSFNGSIVFIIIIVILLIIVNIQNQVINQIINTNYEFCYSVDNQELCSYQRIGDYLKGLD